MRTVVQGEFAPPNWANEADDEPLVIHQRTSKTRNKRLVIFVHGLNGSRYGKDPTGGNFPKFLYEDLPDVDVGLYSYRTGIGRLRFSKSVPIKAEAQILADRIRELRTYKSIVLIGHSLGGVLSEGAVAQLVNSRKVMQRLNGLFLMAAPQLGSLRVPRLFKCLSQDFRALAPHGAYVSEIASVFQNRLSLMESRTQSGRRKLPTWAVVAVGDIWVDPLSASIGLVEEQIYRVRGNHPEIVKPKNQILRLVWLGSCPHSQIRALPRCRQSRNRKMGTARTQRCATAGYLSSSRLRRTISGRKYFSDRPDGRMVEGRSRYDFCRQETWGGRCETKHEISGLLLRAQTQ
jgi:pimeloyl-ACP methyl ester carboxylesterase